LSIESRLQRGSVGFTLHTKDLRTWRRDHVHGVPFKDRLCIEDEKKDPHTIDKQIAAMALIRDMTVVTRNQGASLRTIAGLKMLNPFAEPPAGGAPRAGEPMQ
jgi:hypothetical protein